MGMELKEVWLREREEKCKIAGVVQWEGSFCGVVGVGVLDL